MITLPTMPPPGELLRRLRTAFVRDAVPFAVSLPGDGCVTAVPVSRADNSLGWDGSADVTVWVDGQPVPARVTVRVTLRGSAAWPDSGD